jgi:hypothetical protein
MTPQGSAIFTGNTVKTSGSGGEGRDYAISFDEVTNGNGSISFTNNNLQSQYAFVTVAWDGADVSIPAGQNWIGSPQYVIDNENGFYDPEGQGPAFSQSITLGDSVPGTLNCGPYAAGLTQDGDNSQQCN